MCVFIHEWTEQVTQTSQKLPVGRVFASSFAVDFNNFQCVTKGDDDYFIAVFMSFFLRQLHHMCISCIRNSVGYDWKQLKRTFDYIFVLLCVTEDVRCERQEKNISALKTLSLFPLDTFLICKATYILPFDDLCRGHICFAIHAEKGCTYLSINN